MGPRQSEARRDHKYCPECGRQKLVARNLLLKLDAPTQAALAARAKQLGTSRHKAALLALREALGS